MSTNKSIAMFFITLKPLANTLKNIHVSVAPTDGYGSVISHPCKGSLLMATYLFG